MSHEPEIWSGDSGLCTVMSHLRMGWLKGLANDLLSKSYPCLLQITARSKQKNPKTSRCTCELQKI